MVVSPLNTVPKSMSGFGFELSIKWDGEGAVLTSMFLTISLDNKVDLVFPKIDDFVALIYFQSPSC
jgi:hypothetical protein